MSNTLSPTAIPQAQPVQHTAKHAAQQSAPSEGTEAIVDPVADTRDVIEADDLVEEISIDGMCGVY